MRTALLAALIAVTLTGCGDTGTQEQAQLTPSPPATSTAAATVSPTGIGVTFVNAPLTVARGSNATLTAKTTSNTRCTIEVDYKSGPSTAAGLDAKLSDAAGDVSWTWRVGANTSTGSWPITVKCGDGSAQTFVKVT